MKKLLYFILLSTLCFSINTNGKELGLEGNKSKLENVLKQVKAQIQRVNWHTLNDTNNWAYTVETKLDNGNTGNKIQHTKQRYDPSLSLEKQWQLLESDFEKPSPARLAEYKKTQQQMAEESTQYDTENIEIINLNTLAFIDQNEKQQRFVFTPNLPMFDSEINQIFKGELIFDKQKQQVSKLTIEAQESFSPRLSFKLNRYLLDIDIKERGGELHVVSIISRKTGSAFFITSFDEKSSRQLSDFKKVK